MSDDVERVASAIADALADASMEIVYAEHRENTALVYSEAGSDALPVLVEGVRAALGPQLTPEQARRCLVAHTRECDAFYRLGDATGRPCDCGVDELQKLLSLIAERGGTTCQWCGADVGSKVCPTVDRGEIYACSNFAERGGTDAS